MTKLHFKISSGSIVILFLTLVSVASLAYFFPNRLNLPYADAISRLNIARKVVDNLNPGLAQLGSVWLPLPQLLMLPFIWNDYLWRTGLAGSIMSMIAYIVGGYYLFKSAFLLTKSNLSAFFSLCIYALNINLIYLQTTAMSEALFVSLLSIVMYQFLMWVTTNERRYLIFAGGAVSGITLIRYEGLALLISSILMVVIFTWIKNKSVKRIEGDLILYCFVACFGFALWTIYLTAIFGDPLFWLKYYGFDPTSITTNTANAPPPPQAKPFIAAVWQYFTSLTWMTGIIPMAYACLGLLFGVIMTVKKKIGITMVLLLPLSVFLLMVMTLRRNTPIAQPDLTFASIVSTQTSYQTGFNVRYGLMLLPWLALLTVYVFNLRKPYNIPSILFFALFTVQLFNHVYPQFTAIYEIPRKINRKPDFDMVNWMQQNYDGGYIMISASGFEDQMFALGFPYKTYIHEGAGKYWTESLDRPARYADWIIVDFNRESDWLARELKHKQYWSWDHNLVWEGESVKIYKIKNKPDIDIDEELNSQ